ncbi:transglutaminase TgpA family protein [Microbacterium esteraromaticum]|uniref:transglutaminase TgpA family protein n=1 Tax=Microbacterium esteraromaticum TaxID=57043 RepID=UPI0019D397AE|nr:DUF3488 and transglutaminase-like domain-containing protein [Microbacterium esteraromaticum]MBN7794605.1 transglutaminase domain-containing protein [Microbacterium esteraromaticum]
MFDSVTADSAATRATERRGTADLRPISPIVPGFLAGAAMLVALWPYTGAIMPGTWTFVAFLAIIVASGAGSLGRVIFRRLRAGIRDLLALAVQVTITIMACTALLASDTAFLGLIPTRLSGQLIAVRMQQAIDEIAGGVAPIAASAGLATAVGVLFAGVTILVDQLLAHRQILLTVLLTSVIGVLPMLVSFGSLNIAWFLMQAVMILIMLRFGARHDASAPRRTSALAATIAGATAIAVTLLVTPMLPMGAALSGTGPTLTVRADLRLGDDLRRPESVEALTLVTSGTAPPYLRLATLSRFDGEIWRPDRTDLQPLGEGFGERDWGEAIETTERRVSIRVLNVSSDRLPVPYAPERVTGIDGDWQAMPAGRTVISATENAAGADYTVRTATAAPTLEQIRRAPASDLGRALPRTVNLPPVIADTARSVTAEADTDYDRLIALQDWFRDEFTYSLDAPVDEGFDGTGADAVATFLDKRTGYCVHFAGAFALMAQALDMPVRIVVGYLPGTATDQRRDDDIVYSVSSDQLHSWPEVHFDGIGWVPFEPTATLGVPTAFLSETSAGGSGDGPDAPTPTTAPTTAPSDVPTGGPDRLDEQSIGDQQLQTLNPLPVVLIALGALLLALLPALVRGGTRMLRISRARRGNAMAAWQEVRDTMADLGLPLHAADTARVRARYVVAERGADTDAMRQLVDAVEHRSYAPKPSADDDLSVPLRGVLTALERSVDGHRRVTARLLPASLWRRAASLRGRVQEA